jgi:hypothetical protein
MKLVPGRNASADDSLFAENTEVTTKKAGRLLVSSSLPKTLFLPSSSTQSKRDQSPCDETAATKKRSKFQERKKSPPGLPDHSSDSEMSTPSRPEAEAINLLKSPTESRHSLARAQKKDASKVYAAFPSKQEEENNRLVGFFGHPLMEWTKLGDHSNSAKQAEKPSFQYYASISHPDQKKLKKAAANRNGTESWATGNIMDLMTAL